MYSPSNSTSETTSPFFQIYFFYILHCITIISETDTPKLIKKFKKRCEMIANETTNNLRLKDEDVMYYRLCLECTILNNEQTPMYGNHENHKMLNNDKM